MFRQTPYQFPLINHDPLIRLAQVERALAKIMNPVPSRPTIIKWCEDGTLQAKQILRGRVVTDGGYYHVYQSSLDQFIQQFLPESELAA